MLPGTRVVLVHVPFPCRQTATAIESKSKTTRARERATFTTDITAFVLVFQWNKRFLGLLSLLSCTLQRQTTLYEHEYAGYRPCTSTIPNSSLACCCCAGVLLVAWYDYTYCSKTYSTLYTKTRPPYTRATTSQPANIQMRADCCVQMARNYSTQLILRSRHSFNGKTAGSTTASTRERQ